MRNKAIKIKRLNLEREEQIKVIEYLQILKNQKKIITFFSIPNGGSRNKLEAVNLKKEGLRAGVSDICVILQNMVVFIEMKKKPKVLKNAKISYANITITQNQKQFLDDVNSSNICKGSVCCGFDEMKLFLDNFLKR